MKAFGFEYFQFKERKVKHSKNIHSTVKGRLVNEELVECSKYDLTHNLSLMHTRVCTHAVKMLVYIEKHCFVW